MILPLLGVAVAGLAIHYCLTNAFRYGDAMIVIPMDFLRVPLVAVIGWMFYGEHLDIFVFAGAGADRRAACCGTCAARRSATARLRARCRRTSAR